MANKRDIILKILLPIIIGITAGGILFILGELDDAPGLCLIGVVVCLGLLYLGIHNAGKINKKIKPGIVLPLLVGIVGIVYIAQYLIIGIYDEPPGLVVAGTIISVGLIVLGLIKLKKLKLSGVFNGDK